MYNNPYFNQQYQQDLLNMRERLDRQLQQAQMQPQNQPQQAPITQNFQLAPTQNQNGIKYVKDIDEVKKELVFVDTLFVNKEYTQLWHKNALGEIKTYNLEEVIEMDKLSDMLSELIYMMKEPHNEMYKKYKMCLYEMSNGKILDEDMAMEIVEKMKPYSQHWDMNTTTQVKKEYGLNDIRDIDFYVVMNSLYNDYHSVLEEDTEKYVKMAIAFIRDEDAEEGKVYLYFTNVVKK